MKTKIKTPEYPVVYQERSFKSIRQFDCRVVALDSELNGCGSFMTCIPISSLGHRKKHPTKACVSISTNKEFTSFVISCDWGEIYVMKIHNTLKKEISTAKKSAKTMGLLNLTIA